MKIPGGRHAKRLVLEVLGWVLVVAGLAALVLPGPGLLLLFAGLAVLSQQYDWAERRVDPVRRKAVDAAREGVRTIPRILLSLFGVAWLVGLGVFWGLGPAVPKWWPLADKWWLPGGWGAGASLILSGAVALGMLVYSMRKYRGSDEAADNADSDAGEPPDVSRRPAGDERRSERPATAAPRASD